MSHCSYCRGRLPIGPPHLYVPIIEPRTGEVQPYVSTYPMCSDSCLSEARLDIEWMSTPQPTRRDIPREALTEHIVGLI